MSLFKAVSIAPELYLPHSKVKVRCVGMWHNAVFVGCSDGRLHLVVPTSGYGAGGGTSAARISYRQVASWKDFGRSLTHLQVIEYYNLLVVVNEEVVSFYSIAASHPLWNRTVRESGTVSIQLKLLFTLEESKTATVVGVSRAWDVGPRMSDKDKSKKKLLIAVGVRRAILVYQWLKIDATAKDIRRENALKFHKKIPLPERPRSIVFAQTSMLVGLKSEYLLLDLEGNKDRLFSPGPSKRAKCVKIAGKEILLMVGKQGIIVDYRGRPTRRESIEWSEVPLEVMFCFPYVLALLPRSVEIHHMATQRRVKCVDIGVDATASSGSSLFGGSSSSSSKLALCSSVCYCDSGIWKSFACVSSPTQCFSLNVGSLREQLDELVHLDFYEEALHICDECDEKQFGLDHLDKTSKRLQINELHAYALFNCHQFQEASRKFEQSKVPIRRVFGMFERLLPDGQCEKARRNHPVDVINAYKDSNLQDNAIKMFLIPYITSVRAKVMMAYEKAQRERMRKAAGDLLFGDDSLHLDSSLLISGGRGIGSAATKSSATGTVSASAVAGLAGLGLGLLDTAPTTKKSTTAPLTTTSAAASGKLKDSDLFVDDLAYLDAEKDGSEHEWALMQLIDTMYLKCLIVAADSKSVGAFLQDPRNRCNVEECATVLKRKGKYMDMVWLFKTHGRHSDALSVLKEKCEYLAQNSAIEGDGLTQTVSYLQELGQLPENEHLVLRYSRWVLTRDPHLGLKIFSGKSLDSSTASLFTVATASKGPTADGSSADASVGSGVRLPAISELKVLSHLEKSGCSIECRAEYLEMLINEAKESNAILHNEYIKLQLEWIQMATAEAKKEAKKLRAKYGVAPNDCVQLTRDYQLGIHGVAKKGTLAIVSSITPDPTGRTIVQVIFPDSHVVAGLVHTVVKKSTRQKHISPEKLEGKVGLLRRKLIGFLKTSKCYQPHQVLELFEASGYADTLLEEQSWLRSRIPQHKEALESIVYKLQDFDMAETYCDMVWTELDQKVQAMAASMASAAAASAMGLTTTAASAAAVAASASALRSAKGTTEPLAAARSVGAMLGGGSAVADARLMAAMTGDSGDAASVVWRKKALNRLLGEPDCRDAHNIYLTLLDAYLKAPRSVVDALRKEDAEEAKEFSISKKSSTIGSELDASELDSDLDLEESGSGDFENPFINTALEMLERSHERMDCRKVIEALPDKLPAHKCLPFLRAVLKSVSMAKKRNQITKQLYAQSTLKLKTKTIRLKSRYEVITDTSPCRRCGKWLGKSAFLRFPNGNVYHYVCVSSHQIDPKSHKRFAASRF